MAYRVDRLRRYPVKAMGGESLDVATVDRRGITWDRWYAVEDDDGRFASAKSSRRFRRRDAVFGFGAAVVDGTVRVHGHGGDWPAGDPALDELLSELTGDPVRVAEERNVQHQDGGQVSLVGTASLAWCAEHLQADLDPRRLRVNIVLDTDEPFVEESWVGRSVTIGEAELRVVERIPRCRTVDIVQAQEGVHTTTDLLRPLTRSRDMCLAMYADVVRPGSIRVGDAAEPATNRFTAERAATHPRS